MKCFVTAGLATSLAGLFVACGLDVRGVGSNDIAGGRVDSGADVAGGRVESGASAAPGEIDGWSVVVVVGRRGGGTDSDAGASPCPPGFVSPTVWRDAPRSSAMTCTCRCGPPATDPCTTGTLATNFRNGSSDCNDGAFSLESTGGCHGFPANFDWNPTSDGDYNAVSAAALAVRRVACAAEAVLPPLADEGAATVCTMAPGASSAPPTGSCRLREGDNACPTGFPSRQKLFAGDERSCPACECTSTATSCTNPRFHVFTNADCTGGDRAAPLTGGGEGQSTCNSFSPSSSAIPIRWRYTADADASCTPTAATVPLSAPPSAPSTLCCP